MNKQRILQLAKQLIAELNDCDDGSLVDEVAYAVYNADMIDIDDLADKYGYEI